MKRRQAGFSLIEIMFSLLILGVGIAGMARGVTASLSASKESEIQTRAALFAAGRIEFVRADGYYSAGEDEGECGIALPGYLWKQTMIETEQEGLFHVTVTVVNPPDSERPIFKLETLLFEPPLNGLGTPEKPRTKTTGAGQGA